MNLLGVGAGGAVDARIMDTREHEHLIIGLWAKIASFVIIHRSERSYEKQIQILLRNISNTYYKL